MVIEEKALAKQMKRAYKNGGYTVMQMDGVLTIHTAYFTVEIAGDKVPGNVWGLIAEHAKALPKDGEAWHLEPKEVKSVLPDCVPGVPTRSVMEDRNRVVRTKLNYHGSDVWQAEVNHVCGLIDPEIADIVSTMGIMELVGSWAVLKGGVSSAAVWLFFPKKGTGEEEDLKYLAGKWWRA